METKKKENIAICLNCYKIKFTEKYKKTEKSILDVFGTNKIKPIITEFIKSIDSQKVFKTKSQDRILYLKDILKLSEKDNIFICTIMKGHNGPQTSIDELAGSQVKTVGTVSKDQYHCLPYFLLIYINQTNPKDILFLAQSYRQYGFKEVFEECFREFTSEKSNNTSVKFNPLSVASLFEKQINDGFVKSIRFIKHGLHKNAENVVKGDKFSKEQYEMELAIKAKNGFWGIKESLKYDDASFIENVQIDGFEYNEAYADVVIAGRKRTMNLTKPSEFSAAYDITDKVKIDENTKLPDFKEIMEEALDILKNDLIPYV
ncbi:hypothetical protein KJS94_12450 [Flavihumibacter rivuli]|uniref:hypothetical protein n=1 Tax=Flavihumibacter rivuli TaxID=2838156 RepID=UPI001BDEDD57|nr:hypothetical protein [Flavihumibacter rivuli]ULQ55453.1 hypothetical protein KJS94_12450 [Flavihumibacter rivuli]